MILNALSAAGFRMLFPLWGVGQRPGMLSKNHSAPNRKDGSGPAFFTVRKHDCSSTAAAAGAFPATGFTPMRPALRDLRLSLRPISRPLSALRASNRIPWRESLRATGG
jgi:hypothetical protein